MSSNETSAASRRSILVRQKSSQVGTVADDEDENDEVEYRVKTTAQAIPGSRRPLPPSAEDEIYAEMDKFGSTPTRTRIKNKYRDWDRKQKLDTRPKDASSGTAAGLGCCPVRPMRSRVNRRNTMDCAILNEMFVDDDTVKMADKRAKQLLRESERDMKRVTMATLGPAASLAEATNMQLMIGGGGGGGSDEQRSSDSYPSSMAAAQMLIKCTNQYKSVSTRPAGCRTSAPPTVFPPFVPMSMANKSDAAAAAAAAAANDNEEAMMCTYDRSKLMARREFHETFANLIKLGSDKHDNRASNEIDTWQTELKDLIWLELQAWHAERTPEEQDRFLCAARKDVPALLDKILHYRFKPAFQREVSVDSGVSSATESKESYQELNTADNIDLANLILSASDGENPCKNCISLYCTSCQQQQCTALREVEELLTRLEAAEALYPSSKVMGTYHPTYVDPVFVGRVKAMCLWYNITKYQRLKLTLIGQLFRRISLQGTNFQWPLSEFAYANGSHGSHSGTSQDNDGDSGRDSVDSRQLKSPPTVRPIPKVTFNDGIDSNTDSVSPTDSSSSADSDQDSFPGYVTSTFAQSINDMQQFRLDPISRKAAQGKPNGTTAADSDAVSPYRRYIEHVMKSRGLGKSLSFLHRMHNVIIRKVQLTLERQGSEDAEFDADVFEEESSTDVNETPIDKEQEEELRRYGVWSPEAQALDLPSYAPTFVFLSVVPLEIMHEYLRMRIDSRPKHPNPLSLEQLLKEVREGLILAMTHRERFNKHIHTALDEQDEALAKYMEILTEYDATVAEVMVMYLDYVEHWVLEATLEIHQKAAVVREWSFTKLIAPMIYGQHSVAALKFCHIVSMLLKNIGQRLQDRIQSLNDQMLHNPIRKNDIDKAGVLLICRDMQSLFVVERENSMRVLHFAKLLCRDLEQKVFHRDHELCDGEEPLPDDAVTADGCRPISFGGPSAAAASSATSATVICPEVQKAAATLQVEVLRVRQTLTVIVERVLSECTPAKLAALEEADSMVVKTRTREILHQSFKFGFDYHKELVRLLETKIMSHHGPSCEVSLGIVQFAKLWMVFVTTICERGRGVRPRWAAQGLDFLIAACDPANTKHLTEPEFEKLKADMDACISHVVGMVSAEATKKKDKPRPRPSIGSSPSSSRPTTPTTPTMRPSKMPSPRIIGDEQRALLQQLSVREESSGGMGGGSAPCSPMLVRKQQSYVDTGRAGTLRVPRVSVHVLAMRQARIRDTVNQLDKQLDQKLRQRSLIGQVKQLTDKVQIQVRSVNFRWHRGIKIGQGRFGKVYTAVNNSTGELMAMKEITIQPNETRAIKNVAEELKIFEGISHKYLVKYYGIEVHREELLIFMELCAEGTLESLVLSGSLHEGLTRRFTAQLLTAVDELHKHGVVHRDIKTANIFLTNGGNCLKLGDFGSAVKIQAHTTIPGELKGYVGTQAYMAPEVFTKTNSDGHGRAADIWSSGCVTIEMASGKRPWAQFDSNFQIMFKVGMGETPDIPADLSLEGQQFLEYCLEHDARKRWPASRLLQHNFCKVDLEANGDGKPLTAAESRRARKISTPVRTK